MGKTVITPLGVTVHREWEAGMAYFMGIEPLPEPRARGKSGGGTQVTRHPTRRERESPTEGGGGTEPGVKEQGWGARHPSLASTPRGLSPDGLSMDGDEETPPCA